MRETQPITAKGQTMTNHDQNHANLDLGDDLEITKTEQQAASNGTWVIGTIAGHRFEALVFPAHAENADYELDDSRISKLCIKRIADHREVFNWDRGPDWPAEDETTTAIVAFLAAGLAEHIFGE
jgi:hypothetical protein